MKVTKKDLSKSQIELTIELSFEEFKPYITKGAQKVSQEVKIEGFRPGKAPYDILKQKIGEMTILEEAARLAINKTITIAIKENIDGQPIDQPEVNITKIAPANPMEYKVILTMLPEVKLGDYKNVKVKKEKVAIKNEDVDKTINGLQEMRAKEIIVTREIKTGDKVIVNINIFLDNVPIEGGQSQDTAIIIGKNYLIPGFDKKLIGAKKGDTREFNLPYPKDHYQTNLAGKLVDFKVKIKEVYERQIPKADDEFAKSLGLKNFEELKKNIKTNLEQEEKHKEEQRIELKILDKILAKTKFGGIPEILINREAQTMLAELEQTIVNQGGKFDDYLSSLKKTREQLTLDLLPNTIKRVKSALMIREIANQEKINISEKEIKAKLEELLKQYKGHKKVEDKVKEPAYKAYLQNTLINKKVIDKLKEWNVEK